MTLFAIDLHRAPLVGSHLPETKIPAWACFMTVGFGALVTGLALNHRTAKAIAYATGTLALTAASIDLLFHGEKSEETEGTEGTGGTPPSTLDELPEHPWQLLFNMPEEGDEEFWNGVIDHYKLNKDNYPRTLDEGVGREMVSGLLRQAALGELADLLGDARRISELPLVFGDTGLSPGPSGSPLFLLLTPNGKPYIRFSFQGVENPADTHRLYIEYVDGELGCGPYTVRSLQREWLTDLLAGKEVEHWVALQMGKHRPHMTRKELKQFCEDQGTHMGIDYTAKCILG